ncbi:hypothetical protein [Synechococcus sp. MIT S9504]|uniref:hypothetical protein n=2 Tax=unclassified Synechococcus TaxID=2626047 RepID=UPI0007BBA7E9|nr:hypothetical protein [Synechococcus sp. MIT S9504]KZR87710.1 hypothetical protein MITS9504_00132 [Synechococcus sp. MIT S9504]
MSAGTQEQDQLVPQIPGFTLLERDALLVGSGGVGKTLAALGLSYQTAIGNPNVFDRADEIKPEALGATLWIGTDGGDGAY